MGLFYYKSREKSTLFPKSNEEKLFSQKPYTSGAEYDIIKMKGARKMKKFVLITLVTLALLCVGFAVLYALCFFGNPISKFIATKAVKSYLSENYSDTDYVLEGVYYDFKNGDYFARVTSPKSPDSEFTVTAKPNGKRVYDDYAYRVEGRRNTADRIYATYNAAADKLTESSDFPYYVHILYAEMIYKDQTYEDGFVIPEGAIEMRDLVLDGEYGIDYVGEMSASSGKIVIYVHDENVSVEKMAEILLALRDAVELQGIGFYYVDAVLEYPREDGSVAREGRVEVRDFKCSDIYPTGLADRVAVANAEAEAYYKAQDEIKLGGE